MHKKDECDTVSWQYEGNMITGLYVCDTHSKIYVLILATMNAVSLNLFYTWLYWFYSDILSIRLNHSNVTVYYAWPLTALLFKIAILQYLPGDIWWLNLH